METIKINNDSKILVVKKTSNNIDGKGTTIITISIKMAIGNPNGFNLSDEKNCAPNVFVKFMTSPKSFSNKLFNKINKLYYLNFLNIIEFLRSKNDAK